MYTLKFISKDDGESISTVTNFSAVRPENEKEFSEFLEKFKPQKSEIPVAYIHFYHVGDGGCFVAKPVYSGDVAYVINDNGKTVSCISAR